MDNKDCWNDIRSVTFVKVLAKIVFRCDGGDDLNANEPEPQRDVRTTKGKNSYLCSFLK
jgi:hypothetical protein